MGLSLGANVSILCAAQDKRVSAVVTDAPEATVFMDWSKSGSVYDSLYVPLDLIFFVFLHRIDGVSNPVSILEIVRHIAHRPVFLIGGTNNGSNLEQRSVSQFFTTADYPKEVWIVPHFRHINRLQTQPQVYGERIVGFFDYNLQEGKQGNAMRPLTVEFFKIWPEFYKESQQGK